MADPHRQDVSRRHADETDIGGVADRPHDDVAATADIQRLGRMRQRLLIVRLDGQQAPGGRNRTVGMLGERV